MQPIKVTERRMNAASTQPDVATRQRLAGVFDGITVSSHDIHRRQMRHPVVLYKAVGGRALDRCGQPQHGLELDCLGLGLFGAFDRDELWLFVFGVWALQLVWSPLWLSRFRMGPLEWVWRRLTYGKGLVAKAA